MKLKFAALTVLTFALVTGLPASAQHVEGTTPSPASSSTASGQRAEPATALTGTEPEQKKDAAEALKEPSTIVKKLGGVLGLSPQAAQTAFNWLNFAVLAGAILFAVVRMVPKTLRARTEGIQKHIVDARTATESANARLSAVEARLAKLDDEIVAIRAESERESAEEEARRNGPHPQIGRAGDCRGFCPGAAQPARLCSRRSSRSCGQPARNL